MGPKPRRIAYLAIVLALGACRTRRPRAADEMRDELDRFPHAAHATLGCRECHGADGNDRPGANDHAPCDRCHAAAFQTAPGRLCRICHTAIDVAGGDDSKLRSFPLEGGLRAMPAKFAHGAHLDAGRMERAVGFHIACQDCHPATQASAAPEPPGHDECGRCHAAEVRLGGGPAMGECTKCHVVGDATPRHRRRLIKGDLHFDHRNHLADIRNRRIPCRTCHEGAITATTRDDHAPVSVRDCVTCHDDSDRVPAPLRMRACEACHSTRSETVGALAPRDHLPRTERPLDHTIGFRRDHADAARRDAARCATCHTQLSGSRVDTCDECHQVTRPADHVVTWRELDHGGFAINDSDRCATCHTVDYCLDCHRIRPRSHLAGGRFATLEHGDLARINPRSCMTCHDPQTKCRVGGACHDPTPFTGVPAP